MICAAPAYLKRHGTPSHPDNLTHHNCLCTSLRAWGDQWRLTGKRGEATANVSGSFRTNNAEMLRAAALDVVGITALPTWAVAAELRSGRLRRLLVGWEGPVSTIYAVYPGNTLMSMKVRAFVGHLARHFGRTPYWEIGI